MLTPQIPNRDALKAHYQDAILELIALRGNDSLSTPGFYTQTSDAIFDVGYRAIEDFCQARSGGPKPPRRLHVVSAPAGGGKTSFSFAMAIALTRYAETNADAAAGSVFVVDQIVKADQVFHELNALLPGKVAIWTKDHDPSCDTPEKLTAPATLRFAQDQLRLFPIVVVTQRFYSGTRGHKAANVSHQGHLVPRALTVVDERPEEVTVFETTFEDAEAARAVIEAKHPETKEALDALRMFMEVLGRTDGKIARLTDHYTQHQISERLEWFTADAAVELFKRAQTSMAKTDARLAAKIQQYFGFARWLAYGYAFITPSNYGLKYLGYESKLLVRPGMLLLDATADIDGISQIVPWREHVETPKAHYGSLEIVHVPRSRDTGSNLATYLKRAANQHDYVDWMVATIKAHMKPGEKGLVVCKKVLFDMQTVPPWPSKDARFKNEELYTTKFGWDLDSPESPSSPLSETAHEGRRRLLCATHWGTGVGSNAWKDVDVVFLFDEYYLPLRTALASVQGLKEHRADQGILASLSTTANTRGLVDIFSEGHRLRWTKQMALRGRGRSYDSKGNCGHQRLVVSGDLKSFLANADRLFPGAQVQAIAATDSDSQSWADRVLSVLSQPDLPLTLRTKDLERLLGKPWRALSGNVLSQAQFIPSVEALGWCYVSGKGRGGSKFERRGRRPMAAQAA